MLVNILIFQEVKGSLGVLHFDYYNKKLHHTHAMVMVFLNAVIQQSITPNAMIWHKRQT